MSHKKSENKSKPALRALIETIKDHALKLIIAGVTCAFNILTGGKAMAEKIGNFFSTYGLAGSVIIILVIILTQLLKLPIKKAAVKWAEANGYDETGKKRITQWVALIPFVLAFIFSFFYVVWFQAKWNVDAIDWFDVGKYTVSYATVAIAAFDVVKGFVEAYALKKNQISTPTATLNEEKELTPEEVEAQRIKDENERQAREEKEAKLAAKAQAKADKIKAKKIKKFLALQNAIKGLDLNPEDIPADVPESEEEVVIAEEKTE